MKANFKKYGLIALLIVMAIFSLSQYMSNMSTQQTLREYKNVLIESDSLRKVTEGHYQKLIDDRNSQRDLRNILKEQNRELFELLKEEKKKPISYTIIQARPETKIDTIPITTEVRDGQNIKSFNSFYPNQEDYFISYKGEIKDNNINGEWNFNNLEIGLVISEKSRGLFEADLDAPEWLKVGKIEVNSLPLENIRPDNFDWLVGGSAGFNMTNYVPVFELEGGFRVKKSIFSVTGNTNKELKVGFKKLF